MGPSDGQIIAMLLTLAVLGVIALVIFYGITKAIEGIATAIKTAIRWVNSD